MKFKPLLKSALLALRQHKLRSTLSALGIVFAAVAVVAMLSIAEGAKRETLKEIAQLGTNCIIVRQDKLKDDEDLEEGETRPEPLVVRDASYLRDVVPGIQEVAPVVEVDTRPKRLGPSESVEVLAVDRFYASMKGLSTSTGRFICDGDVEQKNLVCVLGADASNSLGRTGLRGGVVSLSGYPYEVVGVLARRHWVKSKTAALSVRNWNKAVFIPLEAEPPKPKSEPYSVTEMIVRAKPGVDVRALGTAVERALQKAHLDRTSFQVVVPVELLRQARKTQQVFDLVLGSIAGISLLVGGIGIMNIMLASVFERTREIGIRRAIGASRRHVIAQFLAESALLSSSGGIIGVITGLVGASIISSMAGLPTAVTAWSILLSFLMTVCVGLISGLYPAIRAASLDPVAALRHE